MSTHFKLIRGLIITFIVIIVISIIYATLTKRITMRDNSRYNKGYGWKVSFKNLENVKTTGSALEKNKPTINRNDTRISFYDVSLYNPGDSITYVFDVVNEGTLNAIISYISIPKPVCIGFGANAINDAKNVCKHLHYELNYIEDTNNLYNLGPNLHIGDTLYKNQSRKLKLVLKYDQNIPSEELAHNKVLIRNLDIAIIYSQCDKKCNVKGYNAP